MNIRYELIEAAGGNKSIKTQRQYIDARYKMREHRGVQTESDFNASTMQRFSDDNGKTWTQYKDDDTYFEQDGEKEILRMINAIEPNYVTGHIARLVMERIFLYEHKKAYEHYWGTGIMDWRDHTYLEISDDEGKTYTQKYLLSYEDNTGINFNHGYHGTNIEITEDGRILSSICAPLESLTRAYGFDTKDIALNPVITKGVVVFMFNYEKENGTFTVSKSNPILISDEKSSRGLLEPNIIQLNDGTYMLECRGSNAMSDGWDTRMKKGTPGYRWVSFSKDCVDFTEPEPMIYDTGDAFYSPSSISKWRRHSVNRKLYWLGNILEDIPAGNLPRHPLCIGEFDEKNKCLKKDTIMIIDKKGENEGERLQCSNFSFYEDRKTNEFKIEYSRLGQSAAHRWMGDAVRFTISV